MGYILVAALSAFFGGTIGLFIAFEACAMLAKRNGFKPREVFFYNHKPF